jgi:hypothetical protein
VTSECRLAQLTCCESCFDLRAEDVVSIARDERMRFFDEVACPGGMDCIRRCEPATNASLIAMCSASTCAVVDIENDPRLAGCTTDADCSVRVPDCCECGASVERSNLIALNATGMAEIASIACDPDSTCATCAPVYPSDVEAVCHSDLGLCRLADEGAPRPGDYYSCESVTDCTFATPECCGWCGQPRLGEVVAIHGDASNDFRNAVACPAGPPMGCPDCISELNPNLATACNAGTCEAFDIATDTYASCTTAADCAVRAPECCECTSLFLPELLVAMNRDAIDDYLGRVCDPTVDCPSCTPSYPPEVSADCVAGLCQLVVAP